MQADLRRIADGAWVEHFVRQNYEGDWTVLPLRAPASARHPVQMIYSDPSCDTYVDTPLLEACPAIAAALAVFECPLESVRLMRLGAGSIVKTHNDHDLDVEHGRARLHVPIETNPGVDFRLNGEQVVLGEGECWYLRLSDPHSVANRGARDRIHLVIDAIVSPWLREQLELADASSQLPAAGFQLPASGFQLPASGSRLPASSSRLPAAGSGLPASSSRLPAAGSGLPASSSRPSASGARLSASGSRLPTLPAWVPARVRTDSGTVEWCELGDAAIADPFFHETIDRAARASGVVETALDVLMAEAEAHPGIAPTAFIFHCSRCGSTLLSQLARALPGTIVLSEAPAIDDVLRSGWTCEARIEALRAVVAALGQPRATGDRHLVIKFDAWHVVDVPLVQDAFPGVPCVFVYRDPAEVIASQMRMPGQYLLPGALDPGYAGFTTIEEVIAAGREGYGARVLGQILSTAARLAANGRLELLNYTQFPGAAIDCALEWTDRQASGADRARLAGLAAFDAKTPGVPFAASSHPLSQIALDAVAEHARQSFVTLERLRTR
jgi:mannose-6-phosphate isomerase-like protein (cupin superfamily)